MGNVKLLVIGIVVLSAVFSLPAFAAERTVILSIPSMYCEVCPITVQKALTNVRGVANAEVNLEKKEAKVTYEDTKTSVETLVKATRDAGYPSQPKSGVKR